MPVDIRELVIRATVEAPRTPESAPPDGAEQNTEDVVSTCVEQVLEILRRERER